LTKFILQVVLVLTMIGDRKKG